MNSSFCIQVEVAAKILRGDGRIRFAVGAHRLTGELDEKSDPMVMVSQQEGDRWSVSEMRTFGAGSLALEQASKQGSYLFQFTPLGEVRQILEGEVFCRITNEVHNIDDGASLDETGAV